MQPHDELTIKAAALAKSSPIQWRDFLQALATFSNVHKENLVNSPLPALPVNQGRAQILSTLQGILGNCVANAEKFTPKDKP